MSIAEKVSAILEGLSRRDLETLKPEQRQRFAAALRRIAEIADPPALPARPRSGVLFDLYRGNRAL